MVSDVMSEEAKKTTETGLPLKLLEIEKKDEVGKKKTAEDELMEIMEVEDDEEEQDNKKKMKGKQQEEEDEAMEEEDEVGQL